MSNIIEAEGLTKVYNGKIKAVDHFSFQVKEAEIFGFLGPNGAGGRANESQRARVRRQR